MSSQKKKERRKFRYERNVRKEIEHKKEAWESGKLIEENHNNLEYSPEYTIALCDRLLQYINEEFIKSGRDSVNFVRGFRKYRMKIRDLVILWNPNVPEDDKFYFFTGLLEAYWDKVLGKQNLNALVEYYDQRRLIN